MGGLAPSVATAAQPERMLLKNLPVLGTLRAAVPSKAR